MSNTAALSDI